MPYQSYLRGLMRRHGFNQRRLAGGVNMDAGQMSRLLDDEYPYTPSLVTLRLICTALKCTPDERLELYRRSGRVLPDVAEAFYSSEVMARALRKVARMSDEEAARFLAEWDGAGEKGR